MLLDFTKMNGAGNDFILADNRAGTISLTPAQVAKERAATNSQEGGRSPAEWRKQGPHGRGAGAGEGAHRAPQGQGSREALVVARRRAAIRRAASSISSPAAVGTSPHVKVFDGTDGALRQSFLAFDGAFVGGVRVAPFAAVNNAFNVAYVGSVNVNGAAGRVLEPAPLRNFYVGVETGWRVAR